MAIRIGAWLTMGRPSTITLLSETQTQNDYGVWESTTAEREIFCTVDSVTRSEFFEGGRNGLNPELVFTVFFGDYQDEDTLIYEGKAYGIYRTYQGDNDDLELYCERKGGTNGKVNS